MHSPPGTLDSALDGGRRLFAAFALTAFLWLCLGGTASAAPPPNDDFADAATLSGLPASATGTSVDATTEPGEPEHINLALPPSTFPGGHSVWWKWTAPSSGDVTLDTCGSDFDTLLAVYTGTSVEALTPLAYNDNAFDLCPNDASNDSRLSFTAQSGHVYRIAVDGVFPYWCSSSCDPYQTGGIALALHASPQPTNDDFANAAELTDSGASQTNAGATKESGEPNHAGHAGGHSVWWNWTAPRSEPVRFDICGNEIAALLAVYTGDAVGALTEVDSDGDTSCEGSPDVSFMASAGQTYRIAVDSANGAIGGFWLRKAPTELNDDFENAEPMNGLSAESGGSNSAATKEVGEPNHAGNAAGRSLWWRWTAPANGSVQVDTCGSFPPAAFIEDFDTVLAVYTGDTVDGLSEVASNDDLASCRRRSGVTFTATAGHTYRIAVDAASGGFYGYGTVALSLRETPSSGRPPAVKCAGKQVTGPTGTPSNDVVVGTTGPETIRGGGGNDVICGLGAGDRLFGGKGSDRLLGGNGPDVLRGRAGPDVLLGGPGGDLLLGGIGQDELFGGPGADAQQQ